MSKAFRSFSALLLVPFTPLWHMHAPGFGVARSLVVVIAALVVSPVVDAQTAGNDVFSTNDRDSHYGKPWGAHAKKYPNCRQLIEAYQTKTVEIYAIWQRLRWAQPPQRQQLRHQYDAAVAQRQAIDRDIRACLRKEASVAQTGQKAKRNSARKLPRKKARVARDDKLIRLQPCVNASQSNRNKLYQFAQQLQELAQRNVDTAGQTSNQIIKRLSDDFAKIAAFGLTAVEYARQNQNDLSGAVQRDLNRGILSPENDLGYFLARPEQLILDRSRVSKYDPWAALMRQLERYKSGLKNAPGKTAGDIIYDGSNLIPMRRLPRVIPKCKTLKGTASKLLKGNGDAAAVGRANTISANFTHLVQRARRFVNGWGKSPKSGGWGTVGKAGRGTPYNPECGQFNCFAVAMAKARSQATGRHYRAGAIRPSMTSDVTVTSKEVEDVLGPLAQGHPMRNPKLYTRQEILAYALGRPSPMSRQRIAEIMRFSGPGAQGLVFVRYPDKLNPGKTLGHVFNVHNQNGIVRFVDETVEQGQDASFYFNNATEIYFYEYNNPL